MGINMKTNNTSSTCGYLLLSLLAVSLNAVAQQGVPAGGGVLYPGINLSAFHDDNITRSDSNELSTLGWIASPFVGYEVTAPTSRFMTKYKMDAGFYDKSSQDDYVDHNIDAILEFFPTARFDGSLKGEYKDTHDFRGTGRAAGVVVAGQPDPDEWHHYLVEGSLGYGTSSTSRIEGDLGYISKRYDNNLDSTVFRNRDDTLAAARFLYRIAPVTSLVLEGRMADTSYKVISPLTSTLDSKTYRVLGGVSWDATAVTTGSIKVGYMEKKFTAPNRTDAHGVTWELDLIWRPMSYSTLNLYTNRDYLETDGTGDFVTSDTIGAAWTHFWFPHLNSVVDLSYAKDKFQPTTRSDERMNAGIALNYVMRPWATLGVSYRYDDRDSNRDTFDFTRNLFMISANFAL